MSEWRLLVDGEPLQPLTSPAVDYFSGRVVAAPEGKDPPFTVERDRFVTEGAHEDIVVAKHTAEERLLRLDLCFAADFADVLEAQQPGAHENRTRVEVGKRSLTLSFEQDGFRRGTRLSFNRKGELERDRVTFKLTVEPHGRWKLCVDLTPIEGAKPRAPLLRCDSFGAPEPAMPLALQEWLERAPELEAGDDLQHVYQSSLVGPYYGTHDATQLFLILLDEYERWSGDAAFVRKLEPNARAALTWIDEQGDLDGDGYLEYESRSAKGLTNHCWKDSDDSIQFADGRPAEGPIATCEIQGYAYDARLRAARLARELWGDDELAADRERKAKKLRDRFNRDFWDDELGYYVLALEGRKHRVDAIASNAGHLLWSGIVPKNRARLIADRLLRDDLFSGWGIRCLSSEMRGYSPLEYHAGTVWPHDSAICAEGMRRYGLREHAGRVCAAVSEAAVAFEHRLPEVFAGFGRDETDIPVPYPDALAPQAWSAGAPLLALRTLLGLDVVGGRLRSRPRVPKQLGQIALRRIPVRGRRRSSR